MRVIHQGNTGSDLYIAFVLLYIPFKSSSSQTDTTDTLTPSACPHTNISTHSIQYSIASCHIIALFLQHNPMLTIQPQNSPQLPPIASLQLTKPQRNEVFGGFQVSHLCIAAEHRLRGHVYADSCGRLCLLHTVGPSDCWSLATVQK